MYVFHGLYYEHVHLTVYSGTGNDRFKFNWKRSNTKDTLEILSNELSIYKLLRKNLSLNLSVGLKKHK